MERFDCVGSIVAYDHPPEMIRGAVVSFLNTDLNVKLYVVDNYQKSKLKTALTGLNIHYCSTENNLGYGRGHNWAISQGDRTDYYLVFNPDVSFDSGTLEILKDFMDNDSTVGIVMPKVLNEDGSVQYLCKLVPTPVDLVLRRFFPLDRVLDKRNRSYEMRYSGYDETMDVPVLSGCFMFIRSEALRRAGAFDNRYFMYLEDVDLCRRINKHFRSVYYPKAVICHEHLKGSYKNKKLLWYHVRSGVKYFNKWGWFLDKDRRITNRRTLESLARTCRYCDST